MGVSEQDDGAVACPIHAVSLVPRARTVESKALDVVADVVSLPDRRWVHDLTLAMMEPSARSPVTYVGGANSSRRGVAG